LASRCKKAAEAAETVFAVPVIRAPQVVPSRKIGLCRAKFLCYTLSVGFFIGDVDLWNFAI
jgi:hypothetical protein